MTTLRMNMQEYADWVKKLGGRTTGRHGKLFAAVKRGLHRTGLRAVAELHVATSKAPPASAHGTSGAVNTGYYKRAWKTTSVADGEEITNLAPYAGVIEKGRRQGTNFPPKNMIRDWAQRRLGLSREEAERAAFPIARAIVRRGLRARNVMGSVLPRIMAFLPKDIEIELNRELSRLGSGPP